MMNKNLEDSLKDFELLEGLISNPILIEYDNTGAITDLYVHLRRNDIDNIEVRLVNASQIDPKKYGENPKQCYYYFIYVRKPKK